MKEIILGKIFSLILVLLAIGAGYLTNSFFHKELILYLQQLPIIKFIPVILFAWIVLGRCGWDIQTWSGDSGPEIFDQWFFRIIYTLSFCILSTFFFAEHIH